MVDILAQKKWYFLIYIAEKPFFSIKIVVLEYLISTLNQPKKESQKTDYTSACNDSLFHVVLFTFFSENQSPSAPLPDSFPHGEDTCPVDFHAAILIWFHTG